MKTILNIKTDEELKKEAQRVAKNLGLPLGTIVNNFLKTLVTEKRVVFSESPQPNPANQKILDAALADIQEGRNVTLFDSIEEMDDFILKA